jgi:hypothetical protein
VPDKKKNPKIVVSKPNVGWDEGVHTADRKNAIISLMFEKCFTEGGSEMMVNVHGLHIGFTACADLIRQLAHHMRACIPNVDQEFKKKVVSTKLLEIAGASITLRNMFPKSGGFSTFHGDED